MQVIRAIILTLLLVAVDVAADTQEEINHLLGFVANTPCKYERNGTLYDGSQARDHINMKYEYYRDKVKTTEDFIKYSATKSTLSGKKYTIHCPGSEVMTASDWLLGELKAFRVARENSS